MITEYIPILLESVNVSLNITILLVKLWIFHVKLYFIYGPFNVRLMNPLSFMSSNPSGGI